MQNCVKSVSFHNQLLEAYLKCKIDSGSVLLYAHVQPTNFFCKARKRRKFTYCYPIDVWEFY